MRVTQFLEFDRSNLPLECHCNIYLLLVEIDSVQEQAVSMIQAISDLSWITELHVVDRASYLACAQPTIDRLVNEVFSDVTEPVTGNFGQYLISISAQDALEITFHHNRAPLAEVFKESITENPGFDFHTECPNSIIAFGEAKFSSASSPYNNALSQIVDFVNVRKDERDLLHLRRFFSETSCQNVLEGKKAFVAAFSLNAATTINVFNRALATAHACYLTQFSELYLIGVQLHDNRTH